jgi:hypothetical protein
MTDRKFTVRAACILSSVAAIAVAAGCGSPAPEEATRSSGAALADPCASVPFTHQVCAQTPQGGGSSDTLRVVNPLLKTEFGPVTIDPTQVCQCESLVGPPTLSRMDKHLGMSCYADASSALPQLAPPGPPGCTAGVTLRSPEGPDRTGAILANTWVCPIGTPLVMPTNLGAEETCAVDPYANVTWASLPGAARCEYVYAGTSLRTGTDCFGDPVSGYYLLQERIFTTTPNDAGFSGDGGCDALCCMPVGGDPPP